VTRTLFQVATLFFWVVAFVFPTVLFAQLKLPDQIVIKGVVKDYVGTPLPNITVHAYVEFPSESTHRTTKTDVDGKFEIPAPRANWHVQVDEQELLARGYFCFPVGDWLWNQPTVISLVGVPIRPTLLSPSRAKSGEVKLLLTFDVPTEIPQSVFRTYSIETSADCVQWTSLVSTTLVTSPIEILDTAAAQTPVRFYRAVLEDSNTVPTIVPP
jgi:hypothetical protein